MEAVLNHLQKKYGSVEDYLAHIGVSNETMNAIRHILIDEDGIVAPTPNSL